MGPNYRPDILLVGNLPQYRRIRLYFTYEQFLGILTSQKQYVSQLPTRNFAGVESELRSGTEDKKVSVFQERKAITLRSGVLHQNYIRIPRNHTPDNSWYPRVFWGGFAEPVSG